MNKLVDDNTGLFEGAYSEDALTKYMENAVSIMDDKELHKEYVYERMQEKFQNISLMETMSEDEFMRFIQGAGNVSVNNIYNAMTVGDRNFYKKLMGLEDENVKRAIHKISDTWQSEVDDIPSEDQITAEYDEMNEAISTQNEETTYEKAVHRTDMRQAIGFMTSQAKNRSYYIPMEMSGETTMVHLTIKQGNEGERGKISVYTETEEGKISVLMYRKEEDYEILAATDSAVLQHKLKELCDGNVVFSEKIVDGMWGDTAVTNSGREEVSYGELVRQAKFFIHNVLKKL